MKRLAIVGDELIHGFIFPGYINGFDPQLMERDGQWMASVFRGESPRPLDPSIRVVAIASPDEAFARTIAAVTGIETVVRRAEDLPTDLDGVLVMERQGAKHWPMVRPLLPRLRYVFIDKPVTESLADWEALKAAAARHDVRLFGGSSLGYSERVRAARATLDKAGPDASVVLTGPGPWYEYACHLVATAVALYGPEVTGMRGVGSIPQGAAVLEWRRGNRATLQWGKYPGAFRIDAYTADGHEASFVDDPKTYYKGLAQAFVEAVRTDASGDLGEMGSVIAVLDQVGRQLRPTPSP
jgi:predicted dehydrogenase